MFKTMLLRSWRVASVSVGLGVFGVGKGADCAGNTKPKGPVWQAFSHAPSQTIGGPPGLQCIGNCGSIFYQKTANATVLAKHAAQCSLVPLHLRERIAAKHKGSAPVGGKTVFVMSGTGPPAHFDSIIDDGAPTPLPPVPRASPAPGGASAAGASPPQGSSLKRLADGSIKPFVDKLDDAQRKKCDHAINEFFCENGISPFCTESPSYRRMLETLRPAYAFSGFAKSKQHLGPLLDHTFNHGTWGVVKMDRKFEKLHGKKCLGLDGLTDNFSLPMINFCDVKGGLARFMDSIYTGNEPA